MTLEFKIDILDVFVERPSKEDQQVAPIQTHTSLGTQVIIKVRKS